MACGNLDKQSFAQTRTYLKIDLRRQSGFALWESDLSNLQQPGNIAIATLDFAYVNARRNGIFNFEIGSNTLEHSSSSPERDSLATRPVGSVGCQPLHSLNFF